MCIGCWKEYGSPRIDNARTRVLAQLVKALYDDFSCVGGNLHIVTDDWNLEDDHLEFCFGEIRKPGNGPAAQRELELNIANRMMVLSVDERASALAIWEGFLEE